MMKQNKLSCMFYPYEWVEDWTGTACIKNIWPDEKKTG
jgi:hypothetical protein